MGIYLSHKEEAVTSYDVQVHARIALVLKIVEKKVNGKKVPDQSETFFIDRRVVDVKKPTALSIEEAPRLYYLTADDLARLWESFEQGGDGVEVWTDVKEREVSSLVGLDIHNFYRPDWTDLTLWRAGEDIPTSYPMHVDYGMGITDDKFNLDLVKEKLDKNARVRSVKLVEVPDYGQPARGDPGYALEFVYEFSQKRWNDLWRGYSGGGCFITWVKEILKGHYLDKYNPLRLGRARINLKTKWK